MGGKSKQAQRTKNNARPSSSGRSAELLGSFGTRAGAGAALFPTLAAVAPDAALTPDLALCIKKLNKKDPITKTKALQELNELVQNSKVDDVAAMLPNWTYYYKILSVDPDRRVRELTQVCHGAVVASCGRRVAPQLRALLPSWLAAQHDEHAPARSRAQLTLHSTFPDNKLPDAISFCKAEILAYIVDSLLEPSASVSRKLDSEEERASAITRVLVGALGGLRYIAHRLPESHSSWLWEQLAALLKTNGFWKLAGHSALEVRAAWYGAVGALAVRFGAQWATSHGLRAMKLIVTARETGSAAHALWEALILQLKADEEWYSRLDKKELLTKRLIETVEGGGWGSARALSEVLPQLLELLPAEAVTSEFCGSLFDACFTGLEKRNVMGSKSERASWSAGVAACLRVLAERADLPPDAAPCALARCVRAALTYPAMLHTLLPMLASWAQTPRLELLLRSFWQNVACTVQAQLQHLGRSPDQTLLGPLLDKHTLFLLTLHDGLREKPKKPKGVKFADDIELEDNRKDAAESPTDTNISAEVSLLLNHQLDECTQRVCCQYMELVRGGGDVGGVLRGLLPVLEAKGSRELWAALGETLAGRPASPFAVWECGLRAWLSREDTRCEAAVQLTFLLLHQLAEEEQAAIFTAFQELDGEVCDWVLPRAVHCPAVGAQAWLRGGAARAAVLRTTRRALAGASGANDTLLRCLAPLPTGEVPAGEHTVSEVQQLVAYVVQTGSGAGGAGGAAVQLAARLLALLAHRAAPGTDELLVALLMYELNNPDNATEPSEQENCIKIAWRDGVRALPPDRRVPVVLRLQDLILQHLPTESKELETDRIVHCASLAATLATSSDDSTATARALLQPLADRNATAHALRNDLVTGTLNCPFDDHQLVRDAAGDSPFTVPEFLPFARSCVLRAAFIRALCGASPRSPLEDGAVLEACAELLHDQAVVRSIRDGYAFVADYEIIVSTDTHLVSLISDITSLVPPRLLAALRAELTARAARHGLYWARAAHAHRAADCTDSQALTGDGLFHTLQAEMLLTNPKASPAPNSEDNKPSAKFRTLHAVMCRSLHAAHALQDTELASLLQPENVQEPTADVIINAYYRREQTMLYDTDISAAPWSEAVLAASVADFLIALVEEQGWEAPSHHWDFVTISLSSLLASIDKAKHAWGSTKVAMVTRPVLRLLVCVSRFVRAVPSEALKRQPTEHVAALPREWADVFAPTVAHHVYSLLLHILEEVITADSEMTSPRARVVSALCAAVPHVSWTDLPGASQAEYPLQRLTAAAAGVLAVCTHHGHKYLAHCTLRAHKEHSVLSDAENLRAWSACTADSAEGSHPPAPQLSLHALDEPLASSLAAVDAALDDLKVGEDTCEVVPHSEAHSLALGWLLLVEALGSLTSLQRGELALHYAELVREKRYTSLLLPAALRLLPAHVAQYAMDPSSNAPAPKQASELFRTVKEFTIDEPSLSSDVSSLACRALYLAVSGYGAGAARGWWGAAGGRGSRALARLVQAYVTPHLVREQLKAVAERGSKELPDTEVAVHWSSAEVTCCVCVEDRRVELSITLPALYPLVLPTVSSPAPHPHSPAPSTHWLAVYLAYQVSGADITLPALYPLVLPTVSSPAPHPHSPAPSTHWLAVYLAYQVSGADISLPALYPLVLPTVSSPAPHPHSPAPSTHWLAVYLAYQNGSLLSALRMWVTALTARVEASPQCYICYCRLHPTSGRLPSVPCHQCRNKFHPHCLRKWFTSSNKSNCPLCRAAF